jgi:hypothetical protein
LSRSASSTPFSGNHLWEKSSHGETAIVDMLQVCVPFATDAHGQTVYEKMGEEKFLLEDGHYSFQYKPSIFILRQYLSQRPRQDVDLFGGE